MQKILTPLAFLFATAMVVGVFVITEPKDLDQERDPSDKNNRTDSDISTTDVLADLDLRKWQIRDNNTVGRQEAPVKLVQYSDYGCHFCHRFWEEVLPKLKEEFIDTGVLQYEYRDATLHGGHRASEAVWCAEDQDHFWEYHDLLNSRYEKDRHRWNIAGVHQSYAAALGLEVSEFMDCFNERKYRQKVEESTGLARRQEDIPGVPYFLVNGKEVIGFKDHEHLKELIKEELEKDDE